MSVKRQWTRGPSGLVAVLGLWASLNGGGVALAQAAAAGAEAAVPGAAALAPIEAYLRTPDFQSVTISPDGRYLAALAPLKGRTNLIVVQLDTMKLRAVTVMSQWDVISYRWAGEFLLYSLGTRDTPVGAMVGNGGGLFSVRADGTEYRVLMPTISEQWNQGVLSAKYMDFLMPAPNSTSEALVAAPLRTKRSDIYRVDLVSGKRNLLTFDRPGLVTNWVLDAEGVPRVVETVDKEDAPAGELVQAVLIRDGLDQPWRELARTAPGEPPAWRPVAFAPDNRNLIVTANRKASTSAWYLFDVDKKELGERLVGHPRFDVSEGGLIFDPKTRRPVGMTLSDERFQSAYFDERLAALQASLEKTFPNRAVRLFPSAGAVTLVTVFDDRQPTEYYLHDATTRNLKQVLRSPAANQAPPRVAMRPFLLKTRDGLEIPSYYFLPESYRPGQKLPTVVHVHGGPHVRADRWGDRSTGVTEAQILASRGYAVVLPNFRMTPGLGSRIYRGGFGELGRKMSDDHEDAARWAVSEGFADPKRICISGSSYGGYAALWAAVRSSDVFRCAIAGHVVSDLQLQLTSTRTDFSDNVYGVDLWRRIIGDRTPGDWTRAREVSPALHADKVTMPIFIYAGDADQRTPLEQTKAMVQALEKAGHPAEIVMIKTGEGHGFQLPENRREKFETMLKFLDKHLGTGPTPASATAP